MGLCKYYLLTEKGSSQVKGDTQDLLVDLEDYTVLNMELRPHNRYSRNGGINKNEFGSRIPQNYYCRYEFNLNPQISYDIAIKKLFYDGS